jgi:hypothetical protein
MSRASQSARHSFKKMAGCSRRGVAARRSNFDGSCGKQARRPKDRSAGRKCPGSTALKVGRRAEISSCRHQGTLRGVGAGRPARYRRRRPLLARLLHGSSLRHHRSDISPREPPAGTSPRWPCVLTHRCAKGASMLTKSACKAAVSWCCARITAIVAMSGTKHSLAKWPCCNYLLDCRVPNWPC